MSDFITSTGSAYVDEVVRQVVERLHPVKVYLYNQRVNAAGDTTAFKLCVISPAQDKHAAEITIYREVDSDIPFDLLLYTPEEWADILGHPGAFAISIAQKGVLLYG